MTTHPPAAHPPVRKTPVPQPLPQKAFKPIPPDRPAKELGEYLRALVRSTNLKLDAIAARTGLAKSTLSTTMNGTSKTRQSVQNVLDALDQVGRPVTDAEQAEVWRLYDLGRRNHAAQQRTPTPHQQGVREPAGPPPRPLESPTPWDIAVFATVTAPINATGSTPIRLPRRVPGEHMREYQREIRAALDEARRREAWRDARDRSTRPATRTDPRPHRAEQPHPADTDLEEWIDGLRGANRQPSPRYGQLATLTAEPHLSHPPAPPSGASSSITTAAIAPTPPDRAADITTTTTTVSDQQRPSPPPPVQCATSNGRDAEPPTPTDAAPTTRLPEQHRRRPWVPRLFRR